jgi:hypothetical protein
MEILSVIKHFLADSTLQVKFHAYVLDIDNLEPMHKQTLNNINEIYELFPDKTSITRDEYRVFIQDKFPSKDLTDHIDVIQSAINQNIGVEITKQLLESLIERQMATKLMACSSSIVSNQKSGGLADKAEAILQDYHEMVSKADRPDQLADCDMSFEDAIIFRASDSGIQWPLPKLTKYLGGVEPCLGLVIARPDKGKTSFIMNCLAYWAHQLRGRPDQLLYCNNEEGIIGLKARFGVSLLGCETEWAELNPKRFGQEVNKKNGSCVRFHGGVKNVRDVEVLLKRYNPVVTILDQLPKFFIPGSKLEGPQAIAKVYEWFRGKSQEYSTLMLGVAQAGATADNKQWVNDMDINASKTDVPGELDIGIGIGAVKDPGMEDIRFFNIFKNKMKYGRKGRTEATFSPTTCRYKEK